LPPKLITVPLPFFRSILQLLSRKVCITRPFHSRVHSRPNGRRTKSQILYVAFRSFQ
jgi:hypothetical protein